MADIISLIKVLPVGPPGPPGALEGDALGDIDMKSYKIVGAGVVSFNTEYDNGNSGAAKTILLTNGSKQKLTLTAPCALTFDLTGAGVGAYQFRLIEDALGDHPVTAWNGLANNRWLSSLLAPAINTAPNGETIVTVFYDGVGCTQSLAKVGAL